MLEFDPLASASLNKIDEAMIERYVQHRSKQYIQHRHKHKAPASINRELATLRRLLRLAYEWKIINRVPGIRVLTGEHNREFVLNHDQERNYLDFAPQPLKDVALLILDTGLRVGEAVALEWPDVHLEPEKSAKYGYIHIGSGKSKNARRNVSLTARIRRMLEAKAQSVDSKWLFPGDGDNSFLATSLNHQRAKIRKLLGFPKDFVIHSLRYTMLTRLGGAGVDVFSIMRIAGHSSVTVSQRYVHPSPEALERAFERLEAFNKGARGDELNLPATISATADEQESFNQSVNIS